MSDLRVRAADGAHAAAISGVIVQALRQRDALAVIERVAGNFTAAGVARLLALRQVWVAELDNAIVGTASLDGEVVHGDERTLVMVRDLP
ncbi:hypothetical protein [Phytopseudomonas dryadis]|uniref:Uncharacterized protein n=1 Tax=Phytopseudomonas dryadis TaxID=2487520 RepID=A0ABY1ZAG7_9GAMM|nr:MULTISPECIES: hypothetical protein [Pseudomonas]TBV07620.1 hypothetical protein DNK34_07875 [Pseudomonas dryadis]TBV19953.1 hypothetical protein DNK41_00475 [Pseudomonas sp. FRB 230]